MEHQALSPASMAVFLPRSFADRALLPSTMLLAMFSAQSLQAHDVVHAQVDASGGASASDECMDTNDSCRTWAADGECSSNPGFMQTACRESCFRCESAACSNDDPACEAWAAAGECASNERFMVATCPHAPPAEAPSWQCLPKRRPWSACWQCLAAPQPSPPCPPGAGTLAAPRTRGEPSSR